MPVLGKVGLVNKGVYAAGKTYSALDFVKYNGSTFIALKSVKGVTPSDDGTNWQYLARGAELALQNNLLTTQANTYALDAAQGPVIKAAIDSLNDSLSNCATKTELTNSLSDLVKMQWVVATIPANNTVARGVSAPIPSGYKWLGWTRAMTTGWVGYVYPGSGGSTTDFWTNSSAAGSDRSFTAYYLVIKDI